jgi:hypothetical protein
MTTITMKEVAAFLLGEASLDGYWFGERHPISPFWWREHLRASQPAIAPDELERLRKDAEQMREALMFYAEGDHFTFDRDAWDTVSDEPQNYWCDEAGTATVEDGTIAKLALDAAMKGTL